MIRVHVVAEKSISSAMEDKNIGKKTGDNVMEEREVPDVKQKWRFELVERL